MTKYQGKTGMLIWDDYWKKFRIDNTKRATYELAVENTLKLLKRSLGPDCLHRELRVLDVGCGYGDIDILLAQKTNFHITATDISSKAIKRAREQIFAVGLEHQISLVQGDIYNTGFKSNSFDVVISYGYASAASYKGVQTEVHRVLVPGGLAIIDFRNLSLYQMLFSSRQFIRSYKRWKNKEPKIYHWGRFGIKEHFSQYGLELQTIRMFNTYPPILGEKISYQWFLFFENTVGRFLKPLLSRVLLAQFKNVK